MRRSDLFLPASREHRGEWSGATRLLVRAGVIREFGSGLWGFTPAGERVRTKLERRIHDAMRAVGAQEVSLPNLQYSERWRESGRWGAFEGEMFTLSNREGRAMCLAPSHEEGVVHLLDGLVRSYDDLPVVLYQVDAKFRDDHARAGLLRCKEFTMKDAYSAHVDADSLRETYREMRAAYRRLFDDLGLTVAVCGADNSVMGGDRSEEFVAPVAEGSYGIGVSRLLQTIVMQGAWQREADLDSLCWPVTDWGSVAPYRVAVIPIGNADAVREAARGVHDAIGADCLLFDDGQSVGERFAESELLGIPAKVVVGNHYRETGDVEIEHRNGESQSVAPERVPDAVERFAAGD